MKKTAKRALALLLIFALALLPGAALASGGTVCFIAVNDDLLPLSSQAVSVGGQYYVPAGVFAQFRIYSSWHESASTAELTSASRQMFFNLSTGETWDSSDRYYSTSAVMRGSTVYVPLDFVCRQFGLSWSYIRGSGYGDVCRITDGGAALSDALFLRAAQPLMASRYAEYTGSSLPTGGNEGDVSSAESVVFLSFRGLPSMEALDTLDAYGVKAAFFLSAREIETSPDVVRRLAGSGHNVGALCSADPAGDFTAFSDALWSAAHMTSVLAASSSREYDAACSAWCDENGLVFCGYTVDGVRSGAGISSAALGELLRGERAPIMYLRLECCRLTYSNLPAIISLLRDGSVILAACETSEP